MALGLRIIAAIRKVKSRRRDIMDVREDDEPKNDKPFVAVEIFYGREI
jgi:hypothetical protein